MTDRQSLRPVRTGMLLLAMAATEVFLPQLLSAQSSPQAILGTVADRSGSTGSTDNAPPPDAPVRHDAVATSLPSASTETRFAVLNLLTSATRTNPIGLTTNIQGEGSVTRHGKPVAKDKEPTTIRVAGGTVSSGLQSIQGYTYNLFCPAGPSDKSPYLAIGEVINGTNITSTSGIRISGDTIVLSLQKDPYNVSLESYDTHGNSAEAKKCVQGMDGHVNHCASEEPSLSDAARQALPRAAAMVNYLCARPAADTQNHGGDKEWKRLVGMLVDRAKGVQAFFTEVDKKSVKLATSTRPTVLAANVPQ